MTFPWLTFLGLLPIIGGLALLLPMGKGAARILGLVFSLATLAVGITVTLLLIAHGSQRARGSAQGAEAMAELLRMRLGRVVTGFIEEAPFLADAARDLGPRALALPFFATQAEHVTDDIPAGLAKAGFAGPCLPPIGLAPEVPGLIADALCRADAAIASRRADA